MKWSEMSPQQWQRFVNQHVCVTAHAQQQIDGLVFTVDPVSGSVVLVSLQDDERGSVTVVLGHAVTEVQILRAGTEETERRLQTLFLPHSPQRLSPQQLKSRRDRLRLWLEKNRIPVTEDGELLRVAEVLTISAPYDTGACVCNNEIILARVQSLVQSSPADHCT